MINEYKTVVNKIPVIFTQNGWKPIEHLNLTKDEIKAISEQYFIWIKQK